MATPLENLALVKAIATKMEIWQLVCWVCSAVFIWRGMRHLQQIFRSDLRGIPGPMIARCTSYWRPWVLSDGQAPELYYDLHRRYGPLVRTAPGVVSISDPSAISKIYGIGSKFEKSLFYSIFDISYKGNFMPTTFSIRNHSQHQALRRPIAQKYSMTAIRSMEPFVDSAITIFIAAMKELEGSKVNFGEWLQWYAFDVIAAMTFHCRFGFMEERRDVENLIHDIGSGLLAATSLAQVPEWHPWLMGSRWLPWVLRKQPFFRVPDPLRTIVKFTEDCIAEYDQNRPEEDTPDLLSSLRQIRVKGEPISHSDLVNHLTNNLLAGSDTTAISLRAIIYYLIKNPECLKKCRAEVDAADRTGLLSEHISYAECLQLPYLQAVIKEAMRCHPAVSYPLERLVPPSGEVICGHYLKEGTVVGINAAVIHRDVTIFGEDALEFNPERWLGLDQDRIKTMDRNLLTFGHGSRTCIGKNISIMEMGKLVPTILREFDLEWASDEANWRVNSYWFARQEGLVLRLRNRDQNTNPTSNKI